MTPVLANSLFVSLLVQAVQSAGRMGHIPLSVPETTPDGAFAVPADFFSFGAESGFWEAYNNNFSETVVGAVGNRMSLPLPFRVGGTSGDGLVYNPNQHNKTYCDSGPQCSKGNLDIFHVGPSHFDTYKRFQNVTLILQAPMAVEMDMDNSVGYISASMKARGKGPVSAIALGNEPNWFPYPDNHMDAYVKDALDLEASITKNLSLTGDAARIFQVAEIAWESMDNPDFNLAGVMERFDHNSQIKFASVHSYGVHGYKNHHVYNGTNLLQQELMNATAIKNNLQSYKINADFVRSYDSSVPLVISENANALGVPPAKWAGGFGAAIWAVAFHLQAMAIGIQRVCNTQNPSSTHSYWVPEAPNKHFKQPVVQGVFPAAPFIADFVGKDDDLGKVVELNVNNNDYFSAYGLYNLESNKPRRIALVNLRVFDKSTNPNRGTTKVELQVGNGVKLASLRRMTSDYGVFARGYDQGGKTESVSWAGEEFSHKMNNGWGLVTGQQQESLTVDNGVITVPVRDTEAVIVDL